MFYYIFCDWKQETHITQPITVGSRTIQFNNIVFHCCSKFLKFPGVCTQAQQSKILSNSKSIYISFFIDGPLIKNLFPSIILFFSNKAEPNLAFLLFSCCLIVLSTLFLQIAIVHVEIKMFLHQNAGDIVVAGYAMRAVTI